jgi:hypothetical protein
MQNGYGIHTKEHLSPYAKDSAFLCINVAEDQSCQTTYSM